MSHNSRFRLLVVASALAEAAVIEPSLAAFDHQAGDSIVITHPKTRDDQAADVEGTRKGL